MGHRLGMILIALGVPLLLLLGLPRPIQGFRSPNLVTITDIHSDQSTMIHSHYVITNVSKVNGNLVHTFYEPGGSIIFQRATIITANTAITVDVGSFASLPFFFVGYAEIAADIPITGTALCGPGLPPLVDYRGAPRRGAVPLSVSFTNLTCGDYMSLLWSFGDSSVSFSANPVHDYADPGSFTATLTVFGPNFERSASRPNYIIVKRQTFLPLIRAK